MLEFAFYTMGRSSAPESASASHAACAGTTSEPPAMNIWSARSTHTCTQVVGDATSRYRGGQIRWLGAEK